MPKYGTNNKNRACAKTWHRLFYCKIFSQPIYIILHNTHINTDIDINIDIDIHQRIMVIVYYIVVLLLLSLL